MSQVHVCQACGHQTTVPDHFAGRELWCTHCKENFIAPEPGAEPVEAGSPAVVADVDTCPLCGLNDTMRDAKLLYDTFVCSRCSSSFAGRRCGAFVVDYLILQALQFPLGSALGLLLAIFAAEALEDERTLSRYALLIGAGTLLLFLFKDGFRGFSPGKALFGLRVVDKTTGDPLRFGASFKRNLPFLVPFVLLIIAFTLKKGHRLGDERSNAQVIWSEYADRPPFAKGSADVEAVFS